MKAQYHGKIVGRDGETEFNKRSVMCDNRENWVLGRSSSQCNFTELKIFDFMAERRRRGTERGTRTTKHTQKG